MRGQGYPARTRPPGATLVTVDGDRQSEDQQPDVDEMVAEVVAAIDAAFSAGPVHSQMKAAIARGETGYIQLHHPPPIDRAEKRARSWAEIAPLVADQANALKEKINTLGATPEEEELLNVVAVQAQRHRAGTGET